MYTCTDDTDTEQKLFHNHFLQVEVIVEEEVNEVSGFAECVIFISMKKRKNSK